MKLSAHRIPAALLAASACLAQASTPIAPGAWRCGNTYTDRPCQGGQAVAVDDPRSAAQKLEADAMTRQSRAEADRMEQDRLRQERAAANRQVVYIAKPRVQPEEAKAKPAHADASRRKKSRREPEHFTAATPVEKKK